MTVRRVWRPERQRGFALLIVLWAMVLLSLIAAALAASGRSASKIARNLLDAAQAEAAADGAVYAAAFRLIEDARATPTAKGDVVTVSVGGLPVTLRLEDESGKINPNSASPALLAALLAAAGAGEGQAGAQAIVDWRGGGGAAPEDAVAAAYRSAGLAYLPARHPFATLDEVGLVLGMTPALFAAVAPHLSLVHTGLPDPARADPVVARALANVRLPRPQGAAGAAPVAAPPRIVSIVARAEGGNGALFTRRAVLKLGAPPDVPTGFTVLAWEALSSD